MPGPGAYDGSFTRRASSNLPETFDLLRERFDASTLSLSSQLVFHVMLILAG